jgi:2'-5' RNA ligase
MRCFVGIRLTSEVVEPLARACETLLREDTAWQGEKWVPAENLHVTLKFLGEVEDEEVPSLLEQVGTACGEASGFDLALAGLHATPGTRRCRMLWALFDDESGACAALARRIDDAAVAFGVEAATRAFKPHATLCRARKPRHLDPAALSAAQAGLAGQAHSMSVPQVSVFSSRLTPRGPIYSVIGAWRLRGE